MFVCLLVTIFSLFKWPSLYLLDLLLQEGLLWCHASCILHLSWHMTSFNMTLWKEKLEWKIEGGGLWIEAGQSRFEDSIMPHQHSTHILIICRESCYFEDIIKLWIFCLRTIQNFFQVCSSFGVILIFLPQKLCLAT